MAERRMLSRKIIDSARFLKMPPSTQMLYFHLVMRADDDGVVEGYNVMRMTGTTEDDLRVLVAKEFITILNEDLVTFINDWREHNLIRADRKVDSMYKDLLIQVMPDENLLEKKERADRKKGQNIIIDNGHNLDVHGTSIVGEMSAQDRIGKDNIINIYTSTEVDECEQKNEEVNQCEEKQIDYSKIKDEFNKRCPSLPSIREMTDKRKRAIKSFLKKYTEEDLYTLFDMVQKSNFLVGNNNTGWTANFDWIMKPSTVVKIFEGTYKNKDTPKPPNLNHGEENREEIERRIRELGL